MLGYHTETKAYRLLIWKGRKYLLAEMYIVFNELSSEIDDDSQPQKSESRTKVIQLDILSEDEVIEEQFPQKEESNVPLKRST